MRGGDVIVATWVWAGTFRRYWRSRVCLQLRTTTYECLPRRRHGWPPSMPKVPEGLACGFVAWWDALRVCNSALVPGGRLLTTCGAVLAVELVVGMTAAMSQSRR